MNDGPYIEPNADETVIWRHSSGRTMPEKLVSAKLMKRVNFGFRIVWVIWLITWFSRPETWEHLTSRDGIMVLFFTLFVLFLIPKLTHFFGARFYRKNGLVKTSIPIWMSEERLVFSTNRSIFEQELDLADIHEVASDYVMGSPALVVRSSNVTIELLSSEIAKFQTRLFILRPDLKPGR